MGTFYNITYQENGIELKQSKIDSILIAINLSTSTYIDSSTISKINHSAAHSKDVSILLNGKTSTYESVELPYDKHFIYNYRLSDRIYSESDGAFDPTIMPLVNYWGFGYTAKNAVNKVDTEKVEEILSYIGLEKFNLETSASHIKVVKPKNAELDFSAVAKGYAVDILAEYLKSKNIINLMIDIGGEVYASGKNPSNSSWKVGLNTPKESAALRDFEHIVSLDNLALASSGNYRNFHIVDGKKYGHEINPVTGFPELNDLLAVSVAAPTCAEADAIATAAMIMGMEAALKYINSYEHVEACLFFSNNDGEIKSRFTEGMAKLIVKEI